MVVFCSGVVFCGVFLWCAAVAKFLQSKTLKQQQNAELEERKALENSWLDWDPDTAELIDGGSLDLHGSLSMLLSGDLDGRFCCCWFFLKKASSGILSSLKVEMHRCPCTTCLALQSATVSHDG